MVGAGGVSLWTRLFAMGSALSMAALQVAFVFDTSYRTVGIIGLFGAVLPMVFGMAYLLVPSYVGETLTTEWLPAVHLGITYVAVGLLLGGELWGAEYVLTSIGTLLWSIGIGIFVGGLLWTVLPALAADPAAMRPPENRPQWTTQLVMILIPVAVGYLCIGTVGFISLVPTFPTLIESTFPSVVHFYATGFAALLIFALGIRLLTGFFNVTPPTSLSWLVLLCGAVAPGLLSANFWQSPWFVVGAGVELIAVAGYAVLVAVVAYRTENRRIGLYGIGLGGLSGLIAVGIATANVVGLGWAPSIAAHVPLVLNGFLFLTIIGYAYQFFPISNEWWGASDQAGIATILLLGAGTAVQVTGIAVDNSWLHVGGSTGALIGVTGYAYLMAGRVLR
jgi:hypothetical protein